MAWTDDFNRLISAMIRAEGGQDAFLRAVRCSLPETKDFNEALRIAHNTVYHALWDFSFRSASRYDMRPTDFIEFLGARWAPCGAANDPTNLNANWVKNVKAIFYGRPQTPNPR